MGVDILGVGKSGLFAAKKSLETVGHNIANANTEGYSKQNVNLQTNIPIGDGNLVSGSGVRVHSITRQHNELVENRLNKTIANHNFHKERTYQLSQVEDLFNEINNDGLNRYMTKFFNSFRELANQPENETIRSIVREDANLLTKEFKRIKQTLNEIEKSVDTKIQHNVEEVNNSLEKITQLNLRIAELEGVHGETGDLRDQRDEQIRVLSSFFKVRTYLDDKNRFVVNADGVGTLITGTTIQALVAKNTPATDSTNNVSGSTELFFQSRKTKPISDQLKEGTIAALFETRNTEIKAMKDQLDSLAFHFAHSVNAIHRRGYINKPVPLDEMGQPKLSSVKGPISGINFFEIGSSKNNAAETLDLSNEVKSDLSNITTSLEINKPGDNRVALAISKLQHEKMLNDGTSTIEEDYLKSVGSIGLITSKSRLDEEQSEGILAQTRAVKERFSGVSIDEETANMIKFQHAYEASARVLKTANEMFDTVLNLKR